MSIISNSLTRVAPLARGYAAVANWSAANITQKLKNPALASPALAINETCADLKAAGKEVFRAGFGESPFPIPERIVKALEANAHRNLYYPTQGIPELRNSCAKFLNRNGVNSIDAADVMVAPGAKMLIQHIMQSLDAEVVVPTPCWVTYYPSSVITDKKLTRLPTKFANGWRLTPEDIDEFCKNDDPSNRPRRLMVMNYPHNPTGITYNAEELKALAESFRKHEMIVLSDEIYNTLQLTGQEHVPLAHDDIYPEGTITLNGMSKGFGAGGWRLAFASIPKPLNFIMSTLKLLASNSYSLTPGPIQYAAAVAYEDHQDLKDYEAATRRVLAPLGRLCYDILTKDGKIRAVKPQAGYYIFTDFEPIRAELAAKDVTTGPATYQKLLDDTGCAILPGTAFEQTEDFLCGRFCFVDFDGKQALDNLPASGEPDEAWLRKHTPGPIIAAERMAKWAAQF